MPSPRDATSPLGPAWVRPAAMAVVPLGLFLTFFHWRILIPTNWGWLLSGDWGAGLLGWNAVRHDEWRWPLGETQLLAWPNGVTATYTDSNALVALLLKPFSAVLPEPFQFVGLWFLLCLVLQFAIAHALVRHTTEHPWLRLLGAALLSVAPTLFARTPHSNLFAHWTILLALHLYLNVGRDSRRDLGFAGLLALSGLIHPYFVLMNGCIWSGDVMRRAWGCLHRHEFRRLAVLGLRVLATMAGVAAVLVTAGALASGYANGGPGFGLYSMPLDGLFNPFRADYSRFLPPGPAGASQLFEGFQYLGAGLLFLVAGAGAYAILWRAGRARLYRMSWLFWLGPGLLVLTTLALSDQVQLHGHAVAHLSLGWLPLQLQDAFRASGRLFWPCTYVLILAALELVFALPRAAAALIGSIALLLQGVDLIDFAKDIRRWTEAADRPHQWTRAANPAWDRLIAAADLVEFEPPDPHYDDALFYEVAWRASSLKRPVDIMYTARLKPAQQAFETEAQSRFLSGRIDPRRLYVVMDGCPPPGVDPRRLKRLDGVMVIPAIAADPNLDLKSAEVPPPLPIGRTVSLASTEPQLHCLRGRGWSAPEPWGVWSDGPSAELILRLAGPPSGDLILTAAAHPFGGEQGVTVLAGGTRVGRWELTGQDRAYAVRIPRALAAGGVVRLTLRPDHPVSPHELGVSADARKLGVGMVSIRLDPAA